MNTFDLSSVNRTRPVHFIGIGGVSMSALALILKHHGFLVTGSDFKDGRHLDRLRKADIPVVIGHSADNVGDAGLVVYTAAIAADNPELVYARSLDIPVVERPVLLGAIMKRFGHPVAVAGTHGKTTTTSMIAHVLMHAKLDPTVMVGGDLPSIGGNLREGGRDYMVMEACEYCGSFLNFCPFLSVILNVEEDHLDFFRGIEDIISYFKRFVALTPPDGAVVVNADNAGAMESVAGAPCRVVTYGVNDQTADYNAQHVGFDPLGLGHFDLYRKGKFVSSISLNVTGLHNVSNALAAIAVGELLGLKMKDIREGLLEFRGTDRRFQYKGDWAGTRVIDDYAHHPTEIKATLAAAENLDAGRIWCVFQPHTYTRALKLKDSFAKCFGACEKVIVADIYAAREKDNGLVCAQDLVDAINEQTHNAVYAGGFEDIAHYLREHAANGDIILTMGAGDVYKVGELLVGDNVPQFAAEA